MNFRETIFPPGKIFFKGLEDIKCRALLRDTRLFYLTESSTQARNYGSLCAYRSKKTLRLFELTHENIQKLLKTHLSSTTKGLLKVVLGTNVTVGEQVLAAKILLGEASTNGLPRVTDTRRGQRLSYKELNHIVFGNLTREFLRPQGYDGYYAPKKPSIFHGGSFHSEIMLVDAYRTIEKAGSRMPVVSGHSFKWAIPRLFMDFCKKTTRLIKPYNGKLVIFCTGGMAVRMYIQEKGAALPEKIRRTRDFDFTFAVPQLLSSEQEVSLYSSMMKDIMTKHLISFVRFLNKEYIGINARIKINKHSRSSYNDPKLQVPGTGRKVYQVITYQIVTGHGEVTDLVDTALAVYPGASRSMIHVPFSYKIGIPIQKLKYQLRDSMALLSGSFLYKGAIAKRNPIKGSASNKGQKNAERVLQLFKISKQNSSLNFARRVTAPLLQNITIKNFESAKKDAARVNSVLRKIV